MGTKVSKFALMTAAQVDIANDYIPIVDASAGVTKRIKVSDLVANSRDFRSVTQAATLVSGYDYFVSVTTRAASVTINLPDPGSDAQIIDIADVSRQAETYPITVNGGTKIIETGATTYTLNVNGAALRLAYTSGFWKVL